MLQSTLTSAFSQLLPYLVLQRLDMKGSTFQAKASGPISYSQDSISKADMTNVNGLSSQEQQMELEKHFVINSQKQDSTSSS